MVEYDRNAASDEQHCGHIRLKWRSCVIKGSRMTKKITLLTNNVLVIVPQAVAQFVGGFLWIRESIWEKIKMGLFFQ